MQWRRQRRQQQHRRQLSSRDVRVSGPSCPFGHLQHFNPLALAKLKHTGFIFPEEVFHKLNYTAGYPELLKAEWAIKAPGPVGQAHVTLCL